MIDKGKLRELQRKIARQVTLRDRIKIGDIKTIGAFDVAYNDTKGICVGVVCDFETMEIMERSYSIEELKIPYMPGYLAFREGPLIIESYSKLKQKPDVILVEGHGISHFIRCGLATYVGVSLDKVCIGVAKNLLVGEIINDAIYIKGEIRGFLLKTKEQANPIYISPGNGVSIKSSLEIVKKCMKRHKLPEPLHLAHKYSNKLKKTME